MARLEAEKTAVAEVLESEEVNDIKNEVEKKKKRMKLETSGSTGQITQSLLNQDKDSNSILRL